VTSFTPRYYEIEQVLRARIAQLEPDEPLPSDAMLCEEFGVSRMTARNAVQRLVQEGLVYRVPGRGTFVAGGPAHRQAAKVLSFTDQMRRDGKTPTSRVVERLVRPGTGREAQRLGLRDGSSVVAVRRVRLADGEPIALELAVFGESCAPAILAADLERDSLHATLVAAGRVPTSGRARITAETAGDEDARLLDVPAGEPLLVERRLIVGGDGKPLELTESRYVAARYNLDVDFVVELGS
jgi:DNA-binding GntR family transcriptional regulator